MATYHHYDILDGHHCMTYELLPGSCVEMRFFCLRFVDKDVVIRVLLN